MALSFGHNLNAAMVVAPPWFGNNMHKMPALAVVNWLPVSTSHLALSVDSQEQDDHSLLNHFRKCIAMRKALPALQTGSQIQMQQ